MQELFDMQADLNDFTFLQNECYQYKIEEEIITGSFRDLCTHIKEKPLNINLVKLPQAKEGLWIEIKDKKTWETIQSWWLNNYNLALKQEASELTDSTNWKWWRTKVDKYNEQNLKVEVIDIFHFWISQCMLLGLNGNDVTRIYKQKNEVNITRQKEGYLVKDETDCSKIS